LRAAYILDGNIWFWQEGGTGTQLTTTGDAVDIILSDDGALIAFVRELDNYHQEIWVINWDGSDLRALVTSPDFEAMNTGQDTISAVPLDLDWVPATHTLAFNTRLTYPGPGLDRRDDLQLVDADTGNLNQLLPPGQGGDFYYSIDGSQIALVNPTQISVVNADGSNHRSLLNFRAVITYSEYRYYPEVTWMRDNIALRVAIPPEDPHAEDLGETTIWHLPVDGSRPTKIMIIGTSPFLFDPAHISPDGRRLAYSVPALNQTGGEIDLHIAELDGSKDLVYDTGDFLFQAWSTSGKYFIYSEVYNYSAMEGDSYIGQSGASPNPFASIPILDVEGIDPNRFLLLKRSDDEWQLWLHPVKTPPNLIAITTCDQKIQYDVVR
jgi:Tol biopolymer transport system component